MSALPLPLRPWAAPLAVLDPALVPDLAPLLLRLAAALGPFGNAARQGGDEPDGYAGITRRGPLERLLTSEWALLEAEPEEFLRRLSTGELSYLEPERQSQQQERRCFVLFDVGPEQLGAPRLAQLAAWIVLSQRAAGQGATLSWSVLDAPPSLEHVRSGFDEAGVRNYLDSRTAQQATGRALYAWRQFAQTELGSPDELWLIGGQRWSELPMARGLRLLVIAEDESGTALQLQVRPPGKTLQLALPPVETQVRLLRDPFPRSPAARTPRRSNHRPVVGPLVWLPHSRAVCARAADKSGVVCFSIPAKKGGSLGPPRLYQPHGGIYGAEIRAVGGYRSAIFGVQYYQGQLRVQTMKGTASALPTGMMTLPPESRRWLEAAPEALVPCVLQQGTLRMQLEPRRSLVLRPKDRTLEATWSSAHAVHLATLATTLSVHYGADETALRQFDASENWTRIAELGADCIGVHFFAGPRARESVVVQRRDGRWYLPLESREAAFPEIAPGETVIGACYFGGQVRLVTVTEARRLVRLIGLSSGLQRTLTDIGGKLLHVAVSPDHPLLACLRENGDLVIWDLEANCRRCQFVAPAGGSA